MKNKLSIGLSVGGFVVLILGVIIGWVVVPIVIENKIKQETQLIPGSYVYDKWTDIPVPIKLQFYFFNVTNAAELENGFHTKPIVKEFGPYVYTQRRLKQNITHNEEEDTVSYRQNITYFFNRSLSIGDDTDTFTLINVPLFVVTNLISVHFLPWGQSVINIFLKNEKLTRSGIRVKDIVFDGVDAQLYNPLLYVAHNILGLDIPREFQDGKFGFYLNRNNTDDGLWEVYRGKSDSSKFAVIKNVDGESSVSHWTGKYCNMINGTDGSMFPPFVKEDTRLYGYSPDICRSVYAIYSGKTKYKGIPGYRFGLEPDIYTSPYINQDNACFCTRPPKPLNDTCDMNGAFRIWTCKAGVPIILSKPHLLDADEMLLDFIEGLYPDPEIHESYIDVEPNTGFPLGAHKRIQIGVEIQPLPFDEPFSSIPHMLFPISWADEEGYLDDELADEMKSRLIIPLLVVNIGKWVVVGIGCLLALSGIAIYAYCL